MLVVAVHLYRPRLPGSRHLRLQAWGLEFRAKGFRGLRVENLGLLAQGRRLQL